MNQTLAPLGYSFSDTENSEKMIDREHNHSAHNMSYEVMETEKEKMQFILPITLLVF